MLFLAYLVRTLNFFFKPRILSAISKLYVKKSLRRELSSCDIICFAYLILNKTSCKEELGGRRFWNKKKTWSMVRVWQTGSSPGFWWRHFLCYPMVCLRTPAIWKLWVGGSQCLLWVYKLAAAAAVVCSKLIDVYHMYRSLWNTHWQIFVWKI